MVASAGDGEVQRPSDKKKPATAKPVVAASDTSKMDAARLRGECDANEGAVSFDVNEIMEAAKGAKMQKSLNFCGFYTGMSFANAKRLADHYGMDPSDFSFRFNPLTGEVVRMYFSPRAMDIMMHTSSDYDAAETTLMAYLGISEWTVDAGDAGGYYNSPNGIVVELSKPKWTLGSYSAVYVADAEREKEYYKVAPRFYNNKLVVEKQKEIEAGGARTEVLETPGGIKLLLSTAGKQFISDEDWQEDNRTLYGSFELTETQWGTITGKKVKNARGFNYPVAWGEDGFGHQNDVQQWSVAAFQSMLNSMSYVQKWGRRFAACSQKRMTMYTMLFKDENRGYYTTAINDGKVEPVLEKDFDSVAWLKDNSGKMPHPHPVASKKPNAFGLYDTIGNMSEVNEKGIFGGDYNDMVSDCDKNVPFDTDRADGSVFPRLITIRLCSDTKSNTKRGIVLPGNVLLPMVELPKLNKLWMGTFEVTRGQWKALMGAIPKGEGELLGEALLAADAKRVGVEFDELDLLPVSNVSWHDCQRFLEKLNELPATKAEGIKFDLPTAEEWQYAASGGDNGPYGAGVTTKNLAQYAWFLDDSGDVVKRLATSRVNEIGWKTFNKFGLFDMLGNVAEWTSSGSGDKKVVCGGNGDKAPTASECEVAFRRLRDPGSRGEHLGLRLVARKIPTSGTAVSTESSK